MNRNILLCLALLAAACSSAQPEVTVFAATPETIVKGGSAKLVFSAKDAEKLSIDKGVGDVTGRTEVSVTPAETTTYTLTALSGEKVATKQMTVTVGPTPAQAFTLTAAGAITAGAPVNVTVTAVDAANARVAGYTGTVKLTSDDANATLPADFTFTAANAGSITVPVTFRTAGAKRLMATGTVGGGMSGSFSTTSAALAVAAGAPASVRFADVPATVDAGADMTFVVGMVDAFGNPNTTYSTQLAVSVSDRLAPAVENVQVANGLGTVRVNLPNVGPQSVRVTDVNNMAVTAAVETRVRPRAPDSCVLTLPASTTAGSSVAARVRVFDSRGNLVTGYSGTMTFSSSDPQATFPSPYAFEATDGGGLAFLVTPRTAGAQTFTATDAANRLACSAPIGVTPASNRVVVTLPPDANASHEVAGTVVVRDEFGNVATGFTGTVTLASSDASAAFPASLAFTAADAGTKAFAVTFNSRGTQTLTATAGATSGSAAVAVRGFVYTDASPGFGKVRLVVNAAASTASEVQLDLVSNTLLLGLNAGNGNVRGGAFAAGFNLPLDTSRAVAGSPLLVEATTGAALNLGAAPRAVAAALPLSGPTGGVLYSGVSQKQAITATTVVGDTGVVPGGVFYSVRLRLPSTATAGTVFDGTALGTRFRAGVRNRSGDELVGTQDFVLGKLEVR
jgi:hypothetical protein